MTIKDTDILARELAKVATLGAKLSGQIADVDADSAASGAACGARFAAAYLPTEQFRTVISLDADSRTALEHACAYFAEHGRLTTDGETEDSLFPNISGVVGSGYLKMNPALVRVEIIAVDDGGCTLSITAAAKEGLVKQRTAEKAVNRLVQSLQSLV